MIPALRSAGCTKQLQDFEGDAGFRVPVLQGALRIDKCKSSKEVMDWLLCNF